MISRVSSGLTACAAVATAGVIAITPVASPPTPQRMLDASAALMASFEGMNQAGLAFLAGQRLADQFFQAPFVPLALAAQLGAGDGNARLYSQIRQIVDAPTYVADPLIEAIAITLPSQLGGGSDHETTTSAGDGAFMQFRNNEVLGFRDAINAQVAGVLGVSPTVLNENYAADLAAGVQASAVRTVNGAVLGAVGVAAIGQAIADGDNPALYTAIRSYTDAPLWTADPTIEGLEKALPASLGGGTNGGLAKFRDDKLWVATRDTRVAIAGALGVDVNSNGDLVSGGSLQRNSLQSDSGSSNVNKLKPHVTSVNTSLNDAKGKAEKRADKTKANVDKTVKKVQAAAKKVAKKLKPKGSED